MKKERKIRPVKRLLIAAAAFACVGISVAALPANAEAANVTLSIKPEYKQSVARSMLTPLNKWRKQKNWYYTSSNTKAWVSAGELPNLKYDYTLEKYAMQRAAEIAVNFDHTRPNGTKSSGLVGKGYSAIGENIYAATSSEALKPGYVLDKLKEENQKFDYQGHRRNMLSLTWINGSRHNMKYDSVGFSCVKVGKCYYWVQIFGRSSNGVNTKATTAVNSAKSASMTVNTNMIKRKKSPDFSSVKNTSLVQGNSINPGNIKIDIGMADTWPVTYITTTETPKWSVGSPAILSINSNIAYGKAAGTSKAVAKELITGKTKTVTFTVKKSKEKNGLIKEGKYWRLYRKGKKVTGWVRLTAKEGQSKAHWSYFEKGTGNMYTGWHKMSKKEGATKEHMSYFGTDGALRTGWVKFGKGTANPDGNSKVHWSYFGDNGWLRTGWQTMGTAANPDGNSKKHISYFGKNGWLVTGWKHFTKADGEKNPYWSYFGSNGWMRTGWQYLGKADGEKTPHWSYFGSKGRMAVGKNKINGKTYTFNSGGWLIKPKSP